MRKSSSNQGRVGVYGWGIVAPGARNVDALDALLREGRTALRTTSRPELGDGLFAVGDPDFAIDDYVPWIAERKGEAFATRLRKKMGDNVLFALGATIQAFGDGARGKKLEEMARGLDEGCHVYVGSGVGDLPQSYAAARSLDSATRAWNQFWAAPERCPARKRFLETGTLDGPDAPLDPATLPVDSEERLVARSEWDAFWAVRSTDLKEFMLRVAAVESGDESPPSRQSTPPRTGSSEKAHLDDIRRRVRALRSLLDEVGCPPPPWTAVSPDLIWNIQNAPSAQITMLFDVHGPAWAPVGACSTFGVALKTGRDAILRGEAKMAIVGTTDPRPDPALVGAFHEARVMSGTGEVNAPFTSLRGTHLSGGSCIWVLGDAEYFGAQGLEPVGGWIEAIGISSDAEHIITPSVSGPKRALTRAFDEAGVTPSEIAIADLHATGTPGDLNELALVQDYVAKHTRITARKGQLGHGMANSGGWELTAMALGLRAGEAYPTGIGSAALHPNVRHPEAIVGQRAPIDDGSKVGFKLMLGIGGITACVVLRAP